jgi:hypothetical protein
MIKYDYEKKQIVYPFQKEYTEDKPALIIEFPDTPAGNIAIANEPELRDGQWILTYTIYEKGTPEWQAEMDKRA